MTFLRMEWYALKNAFHMFEISQNGWLLQSVTQGVEIVRANYSGVSFQSDMSCTLESVLLAENPCASPLSRTFVSTEQIRHVVVQWQVCKYTGLEDTSKHHKTWGIECFLEKLEQMYEKMAKIQYVSIRNSHCGLVLLVKRSWSILAEQIR